MNQHPQDLSSADAAATRQGRNRDVLLRALGSAGALAIILGAKLWLVANYGSSTPFWDQWVGEARQLYRPYLTGELSLGSLFAAHNEHRIFLTRLIALALFIVEGRWDPIMQTLVNAVIHSVGIGALVFMLSRTLDAARALLLAVLAALMFALPFGWANTLVGFQTPFYLLVLLAPASLWILYASAAWTTRWWLGTLVGILSYFTIASGALTLPAFAVIAAIQLGLGQRRGRGEVLGLLAHIALAAIILWDVSALPPPEEIQAKSLVNWYEPFSVVASWPVAKPSWPLILRAVTAIGLAIPVIVLAARLVQRRVSVRDPDWLVVAVACWTMLQMLALIYGRGITVLQSRYFDVLLLGPLASAAALLHLQSDKAAAVRRASTAFACIWLAAMVSGLGQKAFDDIPGELAWRRETTEAQTRSLKSFLATGDFSALADKPLFQIPFPSAEYLRDTASDPIIRSILPPDLMNRPDPESKLKGVAIRQGQLLMPIGLALLMIALLLGAAASRSAEQPN
jgi:hypothetical protein